MGSIGASTKNNFNTLVQGVNIKPTESNREINVLNEYQQDAQSILNERINEAKKLGYENYEYDYYSLKLKVKNGKVKVTNATRVGKAIAEASKHYNDVIVLQQYPVAQGAKMHYGATKSYWQNTYTATFVVMGRDKK